MPEAAPSEVALPCGAAPSASQASIAARWRRGVQDVGLGHELTSARAAVVGAERDRADVEAVPAEPQQAGADHRQRQVVRPHRVLAEADPAADDQRERQRRRHRR